MKVLREFSIFIVIFSILFATQVNAGIIFQDNFDDNDVSDWTALAPYNLSGGVIYGTGSGYDGSQGARLRHDIGSMNVGTGSFELTFRAISGSKWPNQAYVTLHTDDSHYIGLNVYGESSNYTLDLIEDGQYPYRYYIGPGVLNQWHTYTLARDDSGQFSLRIDGNLLSAWVPPINTKAYNFTAVQIVAGRRERGIDWVEVSSSTTSPNQPPEARFTMTSGSQTKNENETLTLTVAPGATAHVDFLPQEALIRMGLLPVTDGPSMVTRSALLWILARI